MLPQDLSDFFGKLQAKGRATKNVMSPLQYFTWPVGASCMIALIFGPPDFRLVFLIAFLLCIAMFFGFYAYWSFKDPSRLQSEAHTETMTVLTGNMQDNRGLLVDVTPTSNTAVASGSVTPTPAVVSFHQMPGGSPSTVNPDGQPPGTSGRGSP